MNEPTTIFANIPNPLSVFLDPNQRVYWAYLFFALIMASIIYVVNNKQRVSLRGWAGFLFPKEIYQHVSTKNDFWFFLLSRVLLLLLLFPAINAVSPIFAEGAYDSLVTLMGASANHNFTVAHFIVVTVLFLLVSDFAVFIAHYLFHKVPFLWQFHKVHHSAEHLNPLTVYRMHPVDTLFTVITGSIFLGLANGLVHYFYPTPLKTFNIYELNLFLFLFYLFGYNLRHSHIWLSYGPIVSKILISPAQHQIHHSSLPQHIDKNFGLVFSFWDGLFKSLYIPKSREKLEFGLTENEHTNFRTVSSLFFHPFALAYRVNPVLSSVVIIFLVIMTASSVTIALQAPPSEKSVLLEKLTTDEIGALIANGYNTIIIPTGGTEQNNSHVSLGKHNVIVSHTAKKVAEQLGNTLVAPTMAYVPEGEIDPPEGHMRYAGTISITSDTFISLLVEAANSLLVHGFKNVVFLGDSGGNIAPQQKAVEKLEQLHGADEYKFVNAYKYYLENDQTEYLLNKGLKEAEIGDHAGIRDTSELLFTDKSQVRDLKHDAEKSQLDRSGAYWKSSEDIGKAMIDLKIKTAVAEIKAAISSTTPEK